LKILVTGGAGYIAMSGQIVDASLIAAPRQRNMPRDNQGETASIRMRMRRGWMDGARA
jgi:hypothetical protein